MPGLGARGRGQGHVRPIEAAARPSSQCRPLLTHIHCEEDGDEGDDHLEGEVKGGWQAGPLDVVLEDGVEGAQGQHGVEVPAEGVGGDEVARGKVELKVRDIEGAQG